jgi:hypothetical protein
MPKRRIPKGIQGEFGHKRRWNAHLSEEGTHIGFGTTIGDLKGFGLDNPGKPWRGEAKENLPKGDNAHAEPAPFLLYTTILRYRKQGGDEARSFLLRKIRESDFSGHRMLSKIF